MDVISAPSPNFDERAPDKAIDMLVLHYTGMATMEEALARMRDKAAKVSAHYMIDEDGTLYRLVEEGQRAWHAGVSCWDGERDINSVSIGIELVNPGHAYPGYAGGYRAFPEPQMETLLTLAQDIMTRHNIPPHRVLGHSDVAPTRKADPGELFDWDRLALKGLAVMPAKVQTEEGPVLNRGTSGHMVSNFQQRLRQVGYEIEATGVFDENTELVVTAFQRHFRRSQVDGVADRETLACLDALLGLV